MTDELDQLRSFRADSAPSESGRREARAALMAAIDAESRPGPAEPRAPWYRRRPRPLAIAAGLAILAVAVATVSGLDDASIDPPPATAKATLEQAARVAADGADVPLAASEYWYSASEQRVLTPVLEPPASAETGGRRIAYTVLTSFRREAWVSPRGDGRIRHERIGEPVFLDERDRRRWVEAGRPTLATDSDRQLDPRSGGGQGATPYAFGSERLSYEQLRALPTDADRLARRLHAAIPGDRCTNRPSRTTPCASEDSEMALFQAIGALLRETPAPPRLRAALYRVAARIPGIALASGSADSHGRPGVAVSLANAYERRELVFDPDTAALLAERAIALRDRRADDVAGSLIPAGTETEVAYLDSGVVDSTSARP